jgi:5-methylthioadenosine/S-adenosylhomocysteine deaminase
MSDSLVIYGGTALIMDAAGTLVKDAVVTVVKGRIESVTSRPDYRPTKDVRHLDARRCLVMPGLVNGHTHAGMTLLRGIADDLPLHRWLHDKIFPLEQKWGNSEFVYLGTLLAAAEMIRSGTTCFNDMYYFEEEAARAAHEAGLRCIAGQSVTEINAVDDSQDVLARFDDFLAKVAPYPLARPAVTPHSIYGVSDKSWKRIVKYVDEHDLTLQTHLAETQEEEDQCQKKLGITPTEYFERIGLWEQRAIAAHGTCLTPKEIEILGKNQVGVIHNPESNLKLGTRICPVVELRQAGAHVGLGTDGAASNNNLDMLQEADTAAKVQIFRKGIGHLPAQDVVRLLTSEGAQAIGWGDEIGTLEKGRAADLIAIDMHQPHLVPMYNPYSHLVYASRGSDVKHTVVNGKVLMEDRRLTTLDEEAILKEALQWGGKIAGD